MNGTSGAATGVHATPVCLLDRHGASQPDPGRLVTIHHGTTWAPPELVAGVPHLRLHVAADRAGGFTETWTAPGTVHSGHAQGLVYAHTDEYLFAAGHVPEAGGYAAAVARTYSAAFELALALGFPRLFRMWNLVQAINGDTASGVEVYRDFCVGRAEAFERYRGHGITMPAATGVGALGGGVGFHLLAARSAEVTHLENPRQLAAYHYPRRYGPRPPSFARASWVRASGAEPGWGALYVAGTASILSHESVHPGDVQRQCDVALRNIEVLIGRGNTDRYGIATDLSLADLCSVKVYVRHPRHLDTVRRRCASAFDPSADVAFVVADICRRELLVEIEGVAPAGTRAQAQDGDIRS